MSDKTKRQQAHAKREAESARVLDLFLRLRAVAPDPDGEHLWLLLEPPGTEKDGRLH